MSEKQSRFLTENKNVVAYFPFVIATVFLVAFGLYVDRLNSHAEKQATTKFPNLKVILTSNILEKLPMLAITSHQALKGIF